MFNPVAHYGYLLSNMYLFIADIANTTRLFEFEEQRQPSSWPACQTTVYRAPLLGAGGFDTICTTVRDSSTDCRLCRLESAKPLVVVYPLP